MFKKIVSTIIIVLILTCNAHAGTYMFNDKASRIHEWLVSKGESGTVYDALMSYFSKLSGLSSGTLYDHVNTTMVNLGYSGTMSDMLAAFFTTTTSIANPRDAERAFWANTSYDFGTLGGFIFVDNNNFIFVDGNNFTFVN